MVLEMGVTEDLATFVKETNIDDLPIEVIKKTKLNFLDFIGVALAGSAERITDITQRVVETIGGNEQATVIGRDMKTSALNAALLNGFMAHVYDFDDLNWKAIVHPGAPVFAAALSTSEWVNASGKKLIEAAVLGFEAACRIGYAVSPEHHDGYHSTGTCGVFGAAVAAGKLLELNAKEFTYSLGIAGTQSAGLQEVLGTMCKPLHPGKAAMDGVLSALLAKDGFNSSSRILEGNKGFCKVMSPKGYHLNRVTEGLGDTYEIMDTVIKKHSSCGETHCAIDAALEITRKNKIDKTQIRNIEIHVTPTMHDVARFDKPKAGLEGRFSFPYCVALAVIDGHVNDKSQFTDQRLADKNIANMISRTSVVADISESKEDFVQAFRSANVPAKQVSQMFR